MNFVKIGTEFFNLDHIARVKQSKNGDAALFGADGRLLATAKGEEADHIVGYLIKSMFEVRNYESPAQPRKQKPGQ